MANEEQLAILKQGVEVWNRWRKRNKGIKIDLQGADLKKAEIKKANFSGADLQGADLEKARLSGCDFQKANLSAATLADATLRRAILSEAILTEANLEEANLVQANCRGANLWKANLWGANCRITNFFRANLSGSDLRGADLNGAELKYAIFSLAKLIYTGFGDIDLSKTIGLDEVDHRGPSTIGTDTIARSKGKIPEVFLRGCGLSDWEIEQVKLYRPDLSNDQFIDIQNRIFDLHNRQALQISPLFISYSHGDGAFVDKISDQLNKRGIRYWRDIHNMKSGRIERQIDQAIQENPTVLLVLSKNSLGSDWVEHEARTARELEKEINRDVLCPVALDDSWKNSRWPKRVMEQIMEYNILDFSAWQNDSKFDGMFRKLIDGLELFYKG